MAKNSADYLAAIDSVKRYYLDAKWNGTRYQTAAGYTHTCHQAMMLQAIAVQAGHSASNATDIARAQSLVTQLTTTPAYGGAIGQSWYPGFDSYDYLGARDQTISEGLYYAYKYRSALSLSAGQVAAITGILTANRDTHLAADTVQSGHTLDASTTKNNQDCFDWQLNVAAYAYMLGANVTATINTLAQFGVDHMDTPPGAGAQSGQTGTFLNADYGWHYIDIFSMWSSWEYGAMSLGKFIIWYPELSGVMNLSAAQIAKVKSWQRNIYGTWTRSGYPQFDTVWSDMRGYTNVYWMWGMKSLMGMVRAPQLCMNGANDSAGAKWMLDSMIDTFTSTMDRFASDPADKAPAAYPYITTPSLLGSYDARTSDVTWGKEIAAAKFISYLAQAVDLGIADASSADPGMVWGWQWNDKAVFVSTPSYSAASLANAPIVNNWGSDAVQLQHYGVSRLALANGEILTAIGGYGREAFSMVVSRTGTTHIDTGNPATPATTQSVWVDGALQSRVNYDTGSFGTAFTSSLRVQASRVGGSYQALVDTTFYSGTVATTHSAVLTGSTGPATVLLSIPTRKRGSHSIIEYVPVSGSTTTVWSGSVVTDAGSPSPASCKQINIRWSDGVQITIVPTSATLASGARVSASPTNPSTYPRRQGDADRSLYIYLADTTGTNVGTTALAMNISVSLSGSAPAVTGSILYIGGNAAQLMYGSNAVTLKRGT